MKLDYERPPPQPPRRDEAPNPVNVFLAVSMGLPILIWLVRAIYVYLSTGRTP